MEKLIDIEGFQTADGPLQAHKATDYIVRFKGGVMDGKERVYLGGKAVVVPVRCPSKSRPVKLGTQTYSFTSIEDSVLTAELTDDDCDFGSTEPILCGRCGGVKVAFRAAIDLAMPCMCFLE